MNRAVAYLRVSTEEQAKSGLSLESQRLRVEKYAELRALSLDAADIFVDAGVSAGKPMRKRPAGAKLLDRLRQADRPAAVIVTHLDRAWRNTVDCLAIVDRWRRRGVALHIVDEGGNAIDAGSAVGWFMLTSRAAAAQLQRDLGGENTRNAMRAKRARGEAHARVPYGWRAVDTGRTEQRRGREIAVRALEPDAREQAVIEQVRAWSRQGESSRQIARRLEAAEIKTRGGKVEWSHTTVASLLRQATAVGAPCHSPARAVVVSH